MLNETHRPDATEQHALKPVKKQKVTIAKLRPKPGQKVWQLDIDNRLISIAEEDEPKVLVLGKNRTKTIRGIKYKDHHLYCVAINYANAERKFVQMLNILINS